MSAKLIAQLCGAKVVKKSHMRKYYAIFLFRGRRRVPTV